MHFYSNKITCAVALSISVIVRPTNRCRQMSRIIEQNDLQPHQITHYAGEQNGAVFTVAIRVIQSLIREKCAVFPPHDIIVFIHKRRLHPIQQNITCFPLGLPFNIFPQLWIQHRTHLFTWRYIGIKRPTGSKITVNHRGRIGVIKVQQIHINFYIYIHRYETICEQFSHG